MARFDWEAYWHDCEASMGKFRRIENEEYKENELLFQTSAQINARFKQALDEIKLEQDLIPEEVYISFFNDGTLSVNLGATLLDLEVVFNVVIDVRQVSLPPQKGVPSFSFERMVIKEYNRCTREYRRASQELKQSWNARDVLPSEFVQAVRFVEASHHRAFAKLATFSRHKFSNASKREAEAEVGNLLLLLRKLRRLNPKRA